eukprot:gene18640-25155_t
MFKSKMDVALINAEDQQRRMKNDADATQKRYIQAYAAAQTQNETSKQVLEQIHKLMESKKETDAKIIQLQAEMAAVTNMSPAEVASLEAEVATLQATCTQTENAHSSITAQLLGVKKQKELAGVRLAESKEAAASAEVELKAAQAEVDELQQQVTAARSSGEAETAKQLLVQAAKVELEAALEEVDELQQLVTEARSSGEAETAKQLLPRGLHALCEKGGIEVPASAKIQSNMQLQAWADDVAAGIADWTNDDDADLQGFVVVNALSTTSRLPGAKAEEKQAVASVPAASAAAAPVAAAGFGDDAFGDEAFTQAPRAAAPAPAAPPTASFAVLLHPFAHTNPYPTRKHVGDWV